MGAALIGFVGVLVGGLLSGGATFLMAHRAEKRRARASARLLESELKSVAANVSAFHRDLADAAREAPMLPSNTREVVFLLPLPSTELWKEHEARLAEVLEPKDWYAVTGAYDRITVLNSVVGVGSEPARGFVLMSELWDYIDDSLDDMKAGFAAVSRCAGGPGELPEHGPRAYASIGLARARESPPLSPEALYRPRSEPYELRWPIEARMSRDIPFTTLDPKTQFFVLFQEWTMRELDGMTRLNKGDTVGAETAFRECIDRGKQLEVPELEARSYEGLMRAARTRKDPNAERKWFLKAVEVRSLALPR